MLHSYGSVKMNKTVSYRSQNFIQIFRNDLNLNSVFIVQEPQVVMTLI